mmetsp:Transcript_26664/g.79237  ORF Transcript_26664/g.79237 Transcript_26664/m.79237 type:complete len:331 (-) Transcript_26664:1483-2475(-)
MSWQQGIATVFIGNVITLLPMLLNAHPGTKYGVPFPVLARASFGIRGTNLPSLTRALVACGWFGIQTWIGGSALHQLLCALGGGTALAAPSTTALGSHKQLLVIEWVDVRVSTRMRATSGGQDLRVRLDEMRLPIGGLADYYGFDLMSGAPVLGYVYGAYSRTALARSGVDEGQQLVPNDLSAVFAAQGTPVPQACDPVQGLSREYAYPRISTGAGMRYTQAEGYWFNPYFQPGVIRFQVAEPNATSTQLVMGNVTVLNAQPYYWSAGPRTHTFEIYSPGFVNIHTNVIVKTSRWNGKTTFDIRTLSPGPAVGVWDQNQWARTIDAPTNC